MPCYAMFCHATNRIPNALTHSEDSELLLFLQFSPSPLLNPVVLDFLILPYAAYANRKDAMISFRWAQMDGWMDNMQYEIQIDAY